LQTPFLAFTIAGFYQKIYLLSVLLAMGFSITLSKPIYAAQIALYQAYMEESFAGISKNPALFTAINKDTAELYHELIPFDGELAQRMSDKAVNIIKASEAGELLPRIATSRDFFECKYCAYQDRCWDQSVGEEVSYGE